MSFKPFLKQFQYIYENKLKKVKFLLSIQYIIILPRYYILHFENQKIQEEKEETLYIKHLQNVWIGGMWREKMSKERDYFSIFSDNKNNPPFPTLPHVKFLSPKEAIEVWIGFACPASSYLTPSQMCVCIMWFFLEKKNIVAIIFLVILSLKHLLYSFLVFSQ